MTTARTALHDALFAGRHRVAVRLARELARSGAWDLVVAATIISYAPVDCAERALAETRIDVALCAGELLEDVRDARRFRQLISLLASTGRIEEARNGLRLATRAALVDAAPWLELVVALCGRGETDVAREVAEEAVAIIADGAQLWAVVAQLRLAAGEATAALDACERSLTLEPGSPLARLVVAILLAGRGEPEAAQKLLAQARRLGMPESVVSGVARGAGLGLPSPQL